MTIAKEVNQNKGGKCLTDGVKLSALWSESLMGQLINECHSRPRQGQDRAKKKAALKSL